MIVGQNDTILKVRCSISTLAQTCAALAAFIGAVGLYRLQVLKQSRSDIFNNIWNAFGHPPEPSNQVLARARKSDDIWIIDFLRQFDSFAATIRRSTKGLCFFELWQLVAILSSLVGFIFVGYLENKWYTPVGLGVLTLGSVFTTAFCVLAWFRDDTL